MIKSFDEVLKIAKERGPKVVAVACAQDVDVMRAINNAKKNGIVEAILVGDLEKIEAIAKEENINLSEYEVIDIKDLAEASLKAVELVSSKKAHMVMKGLVDTGIILKAVLNKETGLRTGSVLSHVAVFDVINYPRLLLVTDAAMNIQPNFEEKQQIVKNAIDFAHRLGISEPKVAMLAAKEKVYSKMPDTVDAMKMVELNKNGELADCMIAGPLALDTIVNRDAAIMKGITSPVAGDADIIVTPDIISGNTLYKSLAFLSEIKSGGVILGAKVPIVMTSRADNEDTKFYSIMLASLIGSKN